MPDNNALWLSEKRGALEIKPAPYTAPGANEIVIRNRAVAINPVDTMTQAIGDFIFPWLTYPAIFGSDVAGEVVEVGAGVTRFRPGDRVFGHAAGASKSRNSAAEGAFQQYVILLEHMSAAIPEGMSYEQAAVMPLGVSTAACGLFQKDYLALEAPTSSPASTGKTLLVWGGSTSVGGNAIQLAIAAGYEVISTASPSNFDYVRKLGAREVFDYRSPSVVGDIIKAFKGRTCAGALAIGVGSAAPCLGIVHACQGDKFVSMASTAVSFDGAPRGPDRAFWLLKTLPRVIASGAAFALKARIRGVRAKFIFGSSLVANEVGPMIYRDFLPGALAAGRYAATPAPLVVGSGLAQIEPAMAVLSKGVSARKVVVTL